MRPRDSGMKACPERPGWMLMQRARSALPRPRRRRALDLGIRVERDADAEAQLARVGSSLCRIVDRLDVERHAVAAGRPDALEVPLRL